MTPLEKFAGITGRAVVQHDTHYAPTDPPKKAVRFCQESTVPKQTSELSAMVANFKNGIWLLGVASWLFGITDRSIASFSDGYLSAIEIMQLFTASFFFVGWLFLKPATSFSTEGIND